MTRDCCVSDILPDSIFLQILLPVRSAEIRKNLFSLYSEPPQWYIYCRCSVISVIWPEGLEIWLIWLKGATEDIVLGLSLLLQLFVYAGPDKFLKQFSVYLLFRLIWLWCALWSGFRLGSGRIPGRCYQKILQSEFRLCDKGGRAGVRWPPPGAFSISLHNLQSCQDLLFPLRADFVKPEVWVHDFKAPSALAVSHSIQSTFRSLCDRVWSKHCYVVSTFWSTFLGWLLCAQILGIGTFGSVVKAEYRGTSVAVKKVLPSRPDPSKSSSNYTPGDDGLLADVKRFVEARTSSAPMSFAQLNRLGSAVSVVRNLSLSRSHHSTRSLSYTKLHACARLLHTCKRCVWHTMTLLKVDMYMELCFLNSPLICIYHAMKHITRIRRPLNQTCNSNKKTTQSNISLE